MVLDGPSRRRGVREPYFGGEVRSRSRRRGACLRPTPRNLRARRGCRLRTHRWTSVLHPRSVPLSAPRAASRSSGPHRGISAVITTPWLNHARTNNSLDVIPAVALKNSKGGMPMSPAGRQGDQMLRLVAHSSSGAYRVLDGNHREASPQAVAGIRVLRALSATCQAFGS